MIEVIFLIVLGFFWILAATIQDLKTREIANWINFSLIIFALGFRLFYSLFMQESFFIFDNFFYQGLIGFVIFFILSNVFYYSRIFAGGDAKLLMALGTILPFSNGFLTNIKIFILFFILFLFAGAIYGFVLSWILALKNPRKFKREFSKRLLKNKKKIYWVMFLGLVFMLLGFFQNLFFILGIFIFLMPYFYVYAKAVDEVCMIKKIKTSQLTLGDWLYKNVKIGKKIIKANWEGLNEKDLKILKKK